VDKLVLPIALLCAIAATAIAAETAKPVQWRSIQSGVELATFDTGKTPLGQQGRLYVVRVTPGRAQLTVGLASENGQRTRTAAEWCRASRFAVAINAGMFQNDHLSNVGYLRHGTHLNNSRWNSYQAAVAMNRSRVEWFDLGAAGQKPPHVDDYGIVIQNLRLITRQRKNVWSKTEKRWSEAALAIDKDGRLLFLFSRAPYSMWELNNLILGLPLDVAGAMHLEGGPEASLSIHGGGIDLDLSGSYETGFRPDDSNPEQWPIPNVIGVLRAQ